jgi:hypothetical protein
MSTSCHYTRGVDPLPAVTSKSLAELFEAQGYDPTAVEQIPDRAGVSMRTFYRYAPGKTRSPPD